ncbi:MAG: response regulator transcription factor, partial [Cyanobacteria bacterium P01_G01_bin.4]
MPITLLVAEDHGIVRQGIVSILQRQAEFTVVAEACDGLEAVDLHDTHQPDVTLMDLRMPNLEGVDAIARIRARTPDAKIIILTTYDTDEDIYRGLQAGARGYLTRKRLKGELGAGGFGRSRGCAVLRGLSWCGVLCG